MAVISMTSSSSDVLSTAAYARDGFVLLGKLLDDALVQRLIAEEQRFRKRDQRLVVITQLMHRSALIREVATHGPHIAALRQLMGNNICLTHQQYVSKHAHPDTPEIDVPWHQDNGYGRLDPMTDITVWFALNDCDESSGCLWVIPGSQHGPLAEHTDMHGLRGMSVDQPGVALPMRAGEAVAFSGLLVHCSKAHRGPHTRHAFYLRYCEPHVRMLGHAGTRAGAAEGKPVLDDGYSWMVSGEA